jgi:hypothetical protein
MKTDKILKYTFYGVGAIAVVLVILAVIKKNKEGGSGDSSGGENVPDKPNETVIDPKQAAVPTDLKAILAMKDAIAKLKGRKIYAKIDRAKGRSEAKVNDGWGLGTNVVFESTPQGEFLGYAQFVVNDKNSAKDAQGKIYKWIRITLDDKAWNRYNDTKPWLTKQTFKSKNNDFAYFREDVIRL